MWTFLMYLLTGEKDMLYKYKTYYNASGLPELVKETEYNYAIAPMSSLDKIIDFMTAHMRAD